MWFILQEVLTASHCVPHILCRGLVRIRCVHELPRIIHYLSLRHYINGGILRGEIRDLYPHGTFRVWAFGRFYGFYLVWNCSKCCCLIVTCHDKCIKHVIAVVLSSALLSGTVNCVWFGDSLSNTVIPAFSPNADVLNANSKGMWSVKLCCDKILRFSTVGAG